MQLDWLRAHEGHLCVTGAARFALEPGHALPRGFRPELIGSVRPASIMETLLARREAFAIVGPFDVRHPVAEDVDWFARARDLGVACGQVDDVVVEKTHPRPQRLDRRRAEHEGVARRRSPRGGPQARGERQT